MSWLSKFITKTTKGAIPEIDLLKLPFVEFVLTEQGSKMLSNCSKQDLILVRRIIDQQLSNRND
jgi:hypothetical protein